MERFVVFNGEGVELLLQLKDYKGSKENLERKVSRQEVIVKPVAASVNQLKNKVYFIPGENRLR